MFLLPSIISKIERLIYNSFDVIFFTHFTFFKLKLTSSEKSFLLKESSFYRVLNEDKKRSFEHRIVRFINKNNFYGRSNFIVDRKVKLLIAVSAVKLTFGYRKHGFSVLKSIVVYPTKYLSKSTNKLHKGEFNPRLKTLVLSWEDFIDGNKVKDDNINLGIHEFTHIVHINSHKKTDVNSIIFKKNFKDLKALIQKDYRIKKKLKSSNYFRKYAFENHYEFIAVLLENFIETPQEFKAEFPEIYIKIKKMLNFNFKGY